MRKLKIFSLILVLSFGLLLVGCNSSSTQGSSGADDPIKVGYIGALSGGSSTMGVPGKNGIQLAVDEINADGGINGRQIELIAADDKADPATSATQAQKLINEDEVVAILGGPNSGTVKANSEVIAQYGVPELITIAMNDTLIDPNSATFPTTFRMTEDNSYDIRALAEFLIGEGHQNIGVIADNTAYGQSGTESIKKILEEKGLNVEIAVDHPVGAKDLTAQTLKLREANVDAVYVFSLGPEGALFMKTLKQIDWKVPVVGGRGLNMKAFVDLAGDAADGMILPTVINPNKPEAKEFIEKYDEKYNDDPTHVYSSLGYDSMYLLAAALKKSDGEGGDALIEALESLKDIPTVTGGMDHTASFTDDKHNAVNENYIIFNQVKNGAFEFYTDEVESGWE
ncbi:branched-chain amino acid transport system substrate-binding protein [Salirhabdus euzebyi]|uniref:Branched-chain amino acid transport system substrate-binding protein n=1 Tax=Salirhabdus euzebyi TaxID=394506 RepID=A0A841Q5S8_9BACI|nr:ABC transporter substrate-binding protein [Salirhabdus euzebyi]MBB6453713.1 branched-chain amino acid transport system substrate-binding protein [Salirhabdus euzebyi]